MESDTDSESSSLECETTFVPIPRPWSGHISSDTSVNSDPRSEKESSFRCHNPNPNDATKQYEELQNKMDRQLELQHDLLQQHQQQELQQLFQQLKQEFQQNHAFEQQQLYLCQQQMLEKLSQQQKIVNSVVEENNKLKIAIRSMQEQQIEQQKIVNGVIDEDNKLKTDIQLLQKQHSEEQKQQQIVTTGVVKENNKLKTIVQSLQEQHNEQRKQQQQTVNNVAEENNKLKIVVRSLQDEVSILKGKMKLLLSNRAIATLIDIPPPITDQNLVRNIYISSNNENINSSNDVNDPNFLVDSDEMGISTQIFLKGCNRVDGVKISGCGEGEADDVDNLMSHSQYGACPGDLVSHQKNSVTLLPSPRNNPENQCEKFVGGATSPHVAMTSESVDLLCNNGNESCGCVEDEIQNVEIIFEKVLKVEESDVGNLSKRLPSTRTTNKNKTTTTTLKVNKIQNQKVALKIEDSTDDLNVRNNLPPSINVKEENLNKGKKGRQKSIRVSDLNDDNIPDKSVPIKITNMQKRSQRNRKRSISENGPLLENDLLPPQNLLMVSAEETVKQVNPLRRSVSTENNSRPHVEAFQSELQSDVTKDGDDMEPVQLQMAEKSDKEIFTKSKPTNASKKLTIAKTDDNQKVAKTKPKRGAKKL